MEGDSNFCVLLLKASIMQVVYKGRVSSSLDTALARELRERKAEVCMWCFYGSIFT